MRTINVYEYEELKYNQQNVARYSVTESHYNFDEYCNAFATELLKKTLNEKFNCEKNCMVDTANAHVTFNSYDNSNAPTDLEDAENAVVSHFGEYKYHVNNYTLVMLNDDVLCLLDNVESFYGVALKNKSNAFMVVVCMNNNHATVDVQMKGKVKKENKMFAELLVGRYFSTVVADELNQYFSTHSNEHCFEHNFEWFCSVKGFEFYENGHLVE